MLGRLVMLFIKNRYFMIVRVKPQNLRFLCALKDFHLLISMKLLWIISDVRGNHGLTIRITCEL